ncbi:MAG: metal-dependent hydrolase [Planctomycetaceae bacterium]|jgi:inner membrane protein|nr:metal-dependent hydrolase [Planctomycetaceae bacterium]
MDSLTQIALGASTAAVCVPPAHRRRAIVVGALLGTLPDLDVAIDFGGPVEDFTMHRGFSHSLLVLAPLSIAIWLVLRRWWSPAREAPGAWLAAVLLALLTHPLLDAHTAYGTQLFWPFHPPPVSWATVFIIDPLYTLPLLAGLTFVLLWPTAARSRAWLAAGLALSTAYLGWSWIAREVVVSNARASLASAGLPNARIFATPTPLNTLLWRVVAVDAGGGEGAARRFEGLDSLVADDGAIEFTEIPCDHAALAAAADVPAVARLTWFADGFVGGRVEGDELVVTDLRMGQHPDYVFQHVVATRGNPHWHPIESRRVPNTMRADRLAGLWDRIWRAP